jgi:NADPH-dependent 2,4-dienoyl-CoA reductase/sulfur reductase-like enzyme
MSGHVAIVGTGPAGLAAAIEAARTGARVTLIDEAPREGGQIYRQPAPELDLPPVGLPGELARKAALLAEFGAVREKLELRFQTTAHSLYPGPELQIADATASARLTPDAVILATGVSERAIPFPGWTLPGVLYAGGAQALLKAQGVRAGDRVVISGAGALPLAVGAQMAEAGAEIAALALLHSPVRLLMDPLALWAGRGIVAEGLQYLAKLRRAGVRPQTGWAAIHAHGVERLEAVTLARIGGDGQPVAGSERHVEADLLLLNYGFTANSELARMAGAEHRYDPAMGGWLPVAARDGATSVAGVYVAGDGAGLRGALVAEAEGRIVGAAAAAHALGGQSVAQGAAEARRARQERFQRALRRTLDLPGGVWNWATEDTTICRCEGITAGRLARAFADGHLTLDGIKRSTRCGMGWCGGRTCLQATAALARAAGGDWPPAEMRARPVARPVPLGALANPADPA